MERDGTLRFGVLGAARIAPAALLEPARDVDGVEVLAIASRDLGRAHALAERYGVRRVCRYADLYADPELDAIYVPLPASAHADAAVRALEAGKHVLVEKPFASNAAQARRVVAAARAAGKVCAEAFHWRYHPLAARLREVVGEVGALSRIEATFTAEIDSEDAVRHSYALSGGALMDLGCYALNWVRFVHPAPGEPRVVRARMREGEPRVDVETEVELAFPDHVAARVVTAMTPGSPRRAHLRVEGALGVVEVENPLSPHEGHTLRVEVGGRTREETVPGETTFHHQLRAFARAVETGEPLPTGDDDAIANLELIDAAYRAAGLPLRGA